jgi:photosystem II stability/assembly factor-like uncharacterized protein
MNDEELLDALRRTLHSRAESISPSADQRPRHRPTPLHSPPSRRRLVYAAVATAAAAAAAVIAVTLSSPSHKPLSITSETPRTVPHTSVRPSPASTAPPTTLAGPATTVPASYPPATSPTTVPASVSTSPIPVPPGLQPLSVTFVSAHTGWVLGVYPCSGGRCIAIAQTRDGGVSWASSPAPRITLTSGDANLAASASIRFANLSDGWIVVPTATGNGCCGTQLWSTHDGGQSWSPVTSLPGASAGIGSLEISHGVAHAITGGPPFHIYEAPVAGDTWTASPLTLPVGGGPVPETLVVLQGSSGWILDLDRTIIGGARLAAGGQWESWSPPCVKDNGPAVLAAASASQLAAVCHEGLWGPPAGKQSSSGSPPFYELYLSTDGGATFKPAGVIPDANGGLVAASPAGVGTTVVTGGAGVLSATFDGGKSWQTVGSGMSGTASFVGFTTATQGVAVFTGQQGGVESSTLLMTRDGGHSWSPVNL